MATTKPKAAASLAAAKPAGLLTGRQACVAQPLRDLQAEVVGKLKLAWAMAGAGVKPSQPAAADKLAADWFARQTPARRKSAQARAKALITADPVLRREHFGRLAAVEAKTYRGADHAQAALGKLRLDADHLETVLRDYTTNDAGWSDLQSSAYAKGRLTAVDLDKLRKTASPDQVEGAKFKTLKLFLNSVQCLSTVGPGDDEIMMGGVAIDPDGRVHGIPASTISDGFRNGDLVAYAGQGKVLHEWPIVRTAGWPHAYGTLIAMIERDDVEAGVDVAFAALCEFIQREVTRVLADAVGAERAALIQSLFVESLFGAFIVETAELYLELALFLDDVVAAEGFVMTLGAGTLSYYEWAGLTARPLGQFAVEFLGAGGRYRVWMSMGVFP